MSDNVVSLAERRPHLSGRARCLECRHVWEAVAPIGAYRLDCPNCALPKGAWVGACMPPDGHAIWQCQCGNDLFVLRPDRIQCARCGDAVRGYP